MSTTKPAPVLHVRVIGPVPHVQTVTAELAARLRARLGPTITIRTHTRSVRRTGHIRVYLTATKNGDAH